jgi:mannose-6-phosphate isomerase-like protein (cupin superfamily)
VWRALFALAVVTAQGGVLLPGCATPRTAGSTSATPATPRTRVLGSGPRVLLAQVLLPPGARFTLPTSVCQDVLVYVRHGATELDGGRPLLPGRAVRFGLDGAALGNTSGRDAEVYVIVSRAVARRFGPDATLDMQLAPVDPACGEAAPATGLSDLGAQPLVHAGGELRVNILLDEQGQGARHAALTRLDASAAAGVPLHTHEDSAEVIFIEEGEGRMLVGDQHVAVRPGTFVYIPPRTPHSFTPSGNSPLRAMQVYAPAGPEQRFRQQPPSLAPGLDSHVTPVSDVNPGPADPNALSVPDWGATPPVAPANP